MNPAELLDRWDDQQAAYVADREGRFSAILEVLGPVLDESAARGADGPAVVVDLGCGPGSLSLRVLQRFPRVHVVGIDYDPLLLRIASGSLADHADRLTLVDHDLTRSDWVEVVGRALGGRAPHAVVSTTALHWLPAGNLVALYRQVGQLLAPGGVMLNGDHFRFDDANPTLRAISAAHDETTQQAGFAAGAMTWDQWWAAARTIPDGEQLAAERERRFADRPPNPPTTVEFHLAALRQAGFTESAPAWQFLDDYVVLGRLPGGVDVDG